jgi:hypothetical protein
MSKSSKSSESSDIILLSYFMRCEEDTTYDVTIYQSGKLCVRTQHLGCEEAGVVVVDDNTLFPDEVIPILKLVLDGASHRSVDVENRIQIIKKLKEYFANVHKPCAFFGTPILDPTLGP